jgi:hypothetical protein
VQVRLIDVIGVFFRAIAGSSKIADHISCLNIAALLQ